MTECTTPRDDLLEAAPDELAGVAPTALADHVRECRRCGSTAKLLLAEHARLGHALSLLQPRDSADVASDAILASAAPVRRSRFISRDSIQRFAATAFPMAAAAALAIYVVYGRDGSLPNPAPVAEREIDHVRITAPPGAGMVLLTTSDPDITFAWFGQEILP